MTNYNIFVIDDSEDDRLLYRRALQKNPDNQYNISEADSGEEGLGKLSAAQPSCILLDYSMPGQSGVEILKHIREKYPFIAVVMLTGQGDTTVAVNAMKAGAQDYLSKDTINPEVLQKSVHNAIEKTELLRQLHIQNEELKETNSRLQTANEAAQAAAKAKNEFLANMSHELRTPMNSVLGMAELMLTTELNIKQEKYAHAIYNSGTMMLTLVSDILDFSKIEAGELSIYPEPIALSELVAEMMQLLEKSCSEHNVKLILQYDENIPKRLNADHIRLRQIILNLTSNAIKFTKNGEVDIIIKQISKENNKVALRFEIKDTGIGIAKDKQDYIFEKFTQIDSSSTRQYGGTGLGLSICKTLVKLMGGEIGVISEPDKGALFWFEVSFMISANDNSSEDKSVDIIANKGMKAHFLIAEDMPDNRFVLQEILEQLGYNVSLSTDGKETLDMLEKNHDQYDLVFMDCQMPELDGYQVTRIIRDKPWGKKLPIIAITANALVGDKQKCLDAGMTDYLSKPVRFENIEKMLEKYIKGSREVQH